jgi:hypothetical protein
MALREAMQDADGALIQLIEQYDADLLREDRVQMIQEVRDLLSVAKKTAEEDAKYELLNRIQGLDNALEEAMNAPDNIMFGLLESAGNASRNLVDDIGHMGGYRRLMRKGTLRKRTLRKRTLHKRKQRHAKRTLRKQRTRK